jgi:hypothetical protein
LLDFFAAASSTAASSTTGADAQTVASVVATGVVATSDVPKTFKLSIRRGGAPNVQIECEKDETILDLRCNLARLVGGTFTEYKLTIGPYTMLDDMMSHNCIGEEVWLKRVKDKKTGRVTCVNGKSLDSDAD